jgi:hypothetical protein
MASWYLLVFRRAGEVVAIVAPLWRCPKIRIWLPKTGLGGLMCCVFVVV